MWNKLNITLTDEFGNGIEKIFYYDAEIIKGENDINNALDDLILNNTSHSGAFIVDTLISSYITQMCNEALNVGLDKGKEEVKQMIIQKLNNI